MRRALAAAALAVASVASPATAAAGPPPSFDGLPSTVLPAPPEKNVKPRPIPRGATVDGLIVERQPDQPTFGVLVTAAATAQGTCLASPHALVGNNGDSNVVTAAGARFVFVRTQKLVTNELEPKLVVVDVWVDASTLGAREVGRYDIPVSKLTAGPGSVAVYGFRDGGLLRAVVPLENGGFVRGSGVEGHAVTCTHASLALDTTAAGGQVAVVLGEVEVPATPLASDKNKKRPVQISLSTSRTAADRAPILSATVAWADAIHIDTPTMSPAFED